MNITVQRTTQQGIHIVLHPYLSIQLITNDPWLRYRRLPHTVFADKLIAETFSKRGNNCDELFGTYCGSFLAFSMKMKIDSHKGLYLLFKHDGVTKDSILNSSKDQDQPSFWSKLTEAICHLK